MSCRPSMRLYVGNLPPDYSDRDIERLFARYGPIVKIERKHGGYAFVQYAQLNDAEDAVYHLGKGSTHGCRIHNRTILVEFARRSPDADKDASTRCFLCGDASHWAKDCPAAVAQGLDVRSGKCFKCGNVGHLAKHCRPPSSPSRSHGSMHDAYDTPPYKPSSHSHSLYDDPPPPPPLHAADDYHQRYAADTRRHDHRSSRHYYDRRDRMEYLPPTDTRLDEYDGSRKDDAYGTERDDVYATRQDRYHGMRRDSFAHEGASRRDYHAYESASTRHDRRNDYSHERRNDYMHEGRNNYAHERRNDYERRVRERSPHYVGQGRYGMRDRSPLHSSLRSSLPSGSSGSETGRYHKEPPPPSSHAAGRSRSYSPPESGVYESNRPSANRSPISPPPPPSSSEYHRHPPPMHYRDHVPPPPPPAGYHSRDHVPPPPATYHSRDHVPPPPVGYHSREHRDEVSGEHW